MHLELPQGQISRTKEKHETAQHFIRIIEFVNDSQATSININSRLKKG
jgi:hypothetical protein